MILGRLLSLLLSNIRCFTNILDRLRVLTRTPRSGYRFSLSDCWLYLRYAECPGPARYFPPRLVVQQDRQYVQLKIGNRSYYWPSESTWENLDWVHQEIFAPAPHNPHAYEFAGVKVNPGDNVIDAGAFVGFFVDYALQQGARVLALEPVPSLASAMAKTFAAEITEGFVRILPVALGATSGRANLALAPGLYASRLADAGIEIRVVALDDIVGQERVDFIKMDIEGAEMDAVRGGTRTIATHKPRLAIAVYHEHENANQVRRLLHQIRPDYQIRFRGIYACDGCAPRPFMVYAW